jgi:phytoene dehydrogenase-like protein
MSGVAVVGGGHNGLVAAAYLARSGLDVTVFEARDQVGGCASTVDALGVRVNICNCDHVMVRSTPIVSELDLSAHGLTYLDLEPHSLNLTWAGYPPWFGFHDVDATLDSISRSYPGQVAGYRRWVDDALPVVDLVRQVTNDVRLCNHRQAKHSNQIMPTHPM